MKKQNGMSYITLIFWIAIIVVVSTIGINILLTENENRKIENLTTNMLLVQGKIKVIAQENEMNEEENPLIGKKLVDSLEDEKIKGIMDNNVITEEKVESYYIIDSEILRDLNLEDNLEGEYYIVNYETYEIIYSKGIKIEEEIHYTLTELLEHRDKKEQNINEANLEQ